jgi:hypothetical protein
MLHWSDEGMQAVISDPKAGFFVKTPMSPAAASLSRREGTFKLSEDGTLEGDVKLVYSGHSGTSRKWNLESDSATQREEDVREQVKNHLSTAEVTDIKVENVTDPIKPITYAYHVKVPGYAQRTGKRLFLQPNFFHVNYAPEFAESTRRFPVYFHYPWAEHDTVSIELPEGYVLDTPEAPVPINMGKVGRHEVQMKISKDGRLFLLERKLNFGENGLILFPQETYPQLKKVFDAIHQADNHTITFKAGAVVSRAASPGAAQ